MHEGEKKVLLASYMNMHINLRHDRLMWIWRLTTNILRGQTGKMENGKAMHHTGSDFVSAHLLIHSPNRGSSGTICILTYNTIQHYRYGGTQSLDWVKQQITN
jgi:hypothetical protein